VRKLLGWQRYDTPEAVEAINDLYRHELRLWLNLQLASTIERKLEEIYRMANRRLSPRQVQETASNWRRTGGGKDARSASLEIAKRFPLSHRHGDESTVTLQMSRRPSLGLHSQWFDRETDCA
jgi:hypothetical protein